MLAVLIEYFPRRKWLSLETYSKRCQDPTASWCLYTHLIIMTRLACISDEVSILTMPIRVVQKTKIAQIFTGCCLSVAPLATNHPQKIFGLLHQEAMAHAAPIFGCDFYK